ncbi:MAG: class I SAM-dependent methyltransferase [Bdellovibrionaceae bacterium]|nr:class I SAM-dependent methyltransferase [Pseudobdellovibrionaceae bacterium]
MHFEERIPIFLDLGFRQEAISELRLYLDLLWQSNEDLNLISRKMSFEDLIDNHVIDCLLALKAFASEISLENKPVVGDFGSGGGLPGVLYAIQFPQVHFHLFEKSNRKQDFLRRCRASLANNVTVHAEIPNKLPEMDLIMARGFKPLDVILDMSRGFYRAGGKLFLLKARAEKIQEELALARKKFPDLKVRIEPLASPVLQVERHVVVVQRA